MSGSRSEVTWATATAPRTFSLRQSLLLALLWLAASASASAHVWSPATVSDPMASADSLDALLVTGAALDNNRVSKRLFYPLASQPVATRTMQHRSWRRSARQSDHCDHDATGLRTQVCANCAKITRARGAYDECCSNTANAYSWCKRIFDFTANLG